MTFNAYMQLYGQDREKAHDVFLELKDWILTFE